ncbi:HNH endonuclease [Nonomuraea sp. 10N515B]|uniref:HNH endonuclease n=1 Tax=Nonomuraea sp. 10N515B TaxID=3457422 RepID=UPI003FCD1967
MPAEIARAVFTEAGHRCAVPTCKQTAALEIEHIDDWAKVKEHKFENLILLCAVCHARKEKDTNARGLDRKALRQYKANLAVLNGRYSDVERRVLEWFAMHPGQRIIELPLSSEVLVMYLVKEGYINQIPSFPPLRGPSMFGDQVRYEEAVPQKGHLRAHGGRRGIRPAVDRRAAAVPG